MALSDDRDHPRFWNTGKLFGDDGQLIMATTACGSCVAGMLGAIVDDIQTFRLQTSEALLH